MFHWCVEITGTFSWFWIICLRPTSFTVFFVPPFVCPNAVWELFHNKSLPEKGHSSQASYCVTCRQYEAIFWQHSGFIFFGHFKCSYCKGLWDSVTSAPLQEESPVNCQPLRLPFDTPLIQHIQSQIYFSKRKQEVKRWKQKVKWENELKFW